MIPSILYTSLSFRREKTDEMGPRSGQRKVEQPGEDGVILAGFPQKLKGKVNDHCLSLLSRGSVRIYRRETESSEMSKNFCSGDGDDGFEDFARDDEDRTGNTKHTLHLTFLLDR